MKKIFKYIIPTHRVVTLNMPAGAIFRYAKYFEKYEQNEWRVWFEINPVADSIETRTFETYGTGWDIESNYKYLATDIIQDGYVWHLYERV